MSRIERWQNSETGEFYEIEWPDLPDAPQEPAEASQLPVPAPEPVEPPRAVFDGQGPHPDRRGLDPRRARLLARLIRQALEGSDDAA